MIAPVLVVQLKHDLPAQELHKGTLAYDFPHMPVISINYFWF
jgi:hypothetical protein